MYLVWSRASGYTRFEHESFEAAQEEARRLATIYRGEFLILQPVTTITGDVERKDTPPTSCPLTPLARKFLYRDKPNRFHENETLPEAEAAMLADLVRNGWLAMSRDQRSPKFIIFERTESGAEVAAADKEQGFEEFAAKHLAKGDGEKYLGRLQKSVSVLTQAKRKAERELEATRKMLQKFREVMQNYEKGSVKQ